MTEKDTSSRPRLSRERILEAAVHLADQQGLDALTMRRLGSELGVEAMSLYKHVANKDEILDGIIELVIGEIEVPDPGAKWREAMRRRAVSAREVLTRHSWATGLFEARGSTGPAVLHYANAILGNLRSAGFSVENAAHAFWLLDCYIYGHVVQENATSAGYGTPEQTSSAELIPEHFRDQFPHLVEVSEHTPASGYSFDGEFEFGLDLILDGLEEFQEDPPAGGA